MRGENKMRANCTRLYLHYVSGTWDRLPLITPDIQQRVYASIVGECNYLECKVIAVGGIEDPVHLLVRYSPTLSVSKLIKQIKGSSSHFIANELKRHEFFKWQGSYGAFTVSHNHLDRVANYIRNQRLHHQQKSIISHWEMLSSPPSNPNHSTSDRPSPFSPHSEEKT